ncbi:MAG: transcriptional regulator [Sphingomonas sp.]|nr:MAG: transcriptional regulator [Sphingomonas sp.]
MEGNSAERDGRRRRSADSKRRIVEAMLELVREGAVSPSADDVAARAGVGRRTVFRLFSDMEGIYREMQAIMRDRVAPVRAIPLSGDTPAARLDALIDRRVRLFEELMPVSVAASVHRHRSPQLQADHAAIQAELRAILFDVLGDSALPDPLDREALDAALSINLWIRLRMEQKLDVAASSAILHRLAAAVIGSASSSSNGST